MTSPEPQIHPRSRLDCLVLSIRQTRVEAVYRAEKCHGDVTYTNGTQHDAPQPMPEGLRFCVGLNRQQLSPISISEFAAILRSTLQSESNTCTGIQLFGFIGPDERSHPTMAVPTMCFDPPGHWGANNRRLRAC